MRLRKALIRFCGHDRVGDQVDRKGEHLRDEPEHNTSKLVKIHSIARPFSVNFADSGFRPRDLTNMSCALFLTELCPHLGRPLWTCTRAPRTRMRRFCAASGRLPGADRLYNRKEPWIEGGAASGLLHGADPAHPYVCRTLVGGFDLPPSSIIIRRGAKRIFAALVRTFFQTDCGSAASSISLAEISMVGSRMTDS